MLKKRNAREKSSDDDCGARNCHSSCWRWGWSSEMTVSRRELDADIRRGKHTAGAIFGHGLTEDGNNKINYLKVKYSGVFKIRHFANPASPVVRRVGSVEVKNRHSMRTSIILARRKQ
ncbi:hypothetical protein AVEN_151864-1 [Araneus ventricosus]|uniref:Uncharacterized protein n=1 Tax=Araneus ventricosus TaxID=182803 RepID=A0A4Y2JLM2_ARAVE|nr:hypothetical protein AVEN_151864-1 [Araneus ventricosus]